MAALLRLSVKLHPGGTVVAVEGAPGMDVAEFKRAIASAASVR